jgi:hypothetical protein
MPNSDKIQIEAMTVKVKVKVNTGGVGKMCVRRSQPYMSSRLESMLYWWAIEEKLMLALII